MNKTLAIIAIIAAAALASGVFAIGSTQAAFADSSSTSFDFSQEQSNSCSGDTSCSNDATIDFSF
jgi:hypothetical protein